MSTKAKKKVSGVDVDAGHKMRNAVVHTLEVCHDGMAKAQQDLIAAKQEVLKEMDFLQLVLEEMDGEISQVARLLAYLREKLDDAENRLYG